MLVRYIKMFKLTAQREGDGGLWFRRRDMKQEKLQIYDNQTIRTAWDEE